MELWKKKIVERNSPVLQESSSVGIFVYKTLKIFLGEALLT